MLQSFGWSIQGNKPKHYGLEYLQWMYFVYCLNFGLYMLDPWERIIFSEFLYLLINYYFCKFYMSIKNITVKNWFSSFKSTAVL